MTSHRWLSIAIVFGLVQMAMLSTASAEEDFYWKNSYGRGVGTIPPAHACEAGQEDDAGLCYAPCKASYHGVGPVCWENKESYGRGAGTIPPCHEGKEKQAGLCYNPCKAGYHGRGPVCWHEGAVSYGRGVGTPLKSVCGSGKEADVGLCYPTCKAGYDGIGPVCWGQTPTGYVDCAAGFAKDKKTCGLTTAGQVAAVGMLFATAVPGAGELKAALQAEKAAANAKKLEQASEMLSKMGWIKGAVRTLKNDIVESNKGAAFLDDLHKGWKALPYKEQLEIKVILRSIKTGASVTAGAIGEQVSPIDIIRDVAQICSIIDETGAMSVVAAFMYPVYGVDYGKF